MVRAIFDLERARGIPVGKHFETKLRAYEREQEARKPYPHAEYIRMLRDMEEHIRLSEKTARDIHFRLSLSDDAKRLAVLFERLDAHLLECVGLLSEIDEVRYMPNAI